MLKYSTPFRYKDRQEKSEYVYKKYQTVLDGSQILDVGADMCFLRDHLPDSSHHTGVGLGGNCDQVVDLEKSDLPFDDNSFDVVMCLDVLEHIETIHRIMNDLFRVARRHVLISLPNPCRDFWRFLRTGEYAPGVPMKYYNLPLEKPEDRHKWFFAPSEATALITHTAERHGFGVAQIDSEPLGLWPGDEEFLKQSAIDPDLFRNGTLWALLEKQD